MSAVGTKSKVFIEHLADVEQIEPSTAQLLDEALTAFVASARQQWPQFYLTDEQFLRHVAERFPPNADPHQTLGQLNPADLYLACGCSRGDRTAMAAFHDAYENLIQAAIMRIAGNQSIDDDNVKHQLLEKLLLPRGDLLPAIALYAGHGTLAAYVYVSTVRAAAKVLGKNARLRSFDDVVSVDSNDDPELAALKRRYRHQFKAAFQASLTELPSRDRNLLRYHYLSELTTREIATITGVDHSTVSRRLARVRASLLVATRSHLMDDLGVDKGEFESIARLVESQLDFSIERFLGSQAEGSQAD